MNPASEDQPPDVAAKKTLQHGSGSWMDLFTPGWVACLIAFLLCVLYPNVILGTHSFFARDYGIFTYPVAFYTHESFWHGQVPLWNPLDNCGVPFLAQWNTSVCYPLSLIHMIFPLPWSLNLFCLGHLVLAGTGMYLLAYRWTQNRFAASIAGLVFALNGLMINSLEWTSNLAALSWQPLVVLWVEHAWKSGGRRMVIAALAGAMQMLAGAPEIVVFTWTLLGLLWLGQAWRKQIPWGPGLRRFVVVVGLITGLSAVQLLPFFDLLKHSERNTAYFLADAWPMPIWGWANFLVPGFHCLRTIYGTYMQEDQPWTSSYYLGVGTMALAAVGVWRLRRQPGIGGLAGITLGALLLATGNDGHVYAWLKHLVPWIAFARFPIKFVSIPVFTVPLLAAFGFNSLQNAPSQNVKRSEPALFVVAAFLLLVILFLLAMARWRPAPGLSWQETWGDGIWRLILFAAFIGAISALIRMPTMQLRRRMGLVALALIGLDLMTVGTSVNPTVAAKAFDPLVLEMTSRPKPGEARAMLNLQIELYLRAVQIENPLYYYVTLRGSLFADCNIPENIPKVDGFCSLPLKNELDIEKFLFNTNQAEINARSGPLLDFLGVSQSVSEISATNTTFSWQERPSCLPLATAGQRPVFADDPETLKRMESVDFDPRQMVYLPLSARDHVTVTNASVAKVVSQQFGAQQVQLTVEAPAPALVVIAQTFYHNWHVFVDGKPVPLWRANHAFQALEIPAGQHEITLRYVDWMFRLGAAISALTLLGCLTGLLAKPGR